MGLPDHVFRRSWQSYLVLVEGILLIAFGAVGLVKTGFEPLTSVPSEYLLGFRLNPLHSLLLTVVGLLSAATFLRPAMLPRFLTGQIVLFLILFLYGSATSAGSPRVTFLNLNAADNFLHAGLCALGLALGMSIALGSNESSESGSPGDHS